MPKRIPLKTVIVHRDGKSVAAPIGKPFDFTEAELADIARHNPSAVKRVEIAASDEDYVKPAAKTEGGEKEPADPVAAARAKAAAAAAAADDGKPGDADL